MALMFFISLPDKLNPYLSAPGYGSYDVSSMVTEHWYESHQEQAVDIGTNS